MSNTNPKPAARSAGSKELDIAGGNDALVTSPNLNKQARSWRDVLPVHPAADSFPPLPDEQQRELACDIERHGLKVPVVLWSPGYDGDSIKDHPTYLLDGRNRLDALEQLGSELIDDDGCLKRGRVDWVHVREKKLVTPMTFGRAGRTKDKIRPSVNPYDYVISTNIRRRHLTSDQKRELVAKLLKRDPGKSDRQIATLTDSNRTTVGEVRRNLVASGEVSITDTRTDRNGRKQSASRPKAKPANSGLQQGELEQTTAQVSANACKAGYAQEGQELEKIDKCAELGVPAEPTEAEITPGTELGKVAMTALRRLVLAADRDPDLAEHLITIAAKQTPDPLSAAAIDRVIALLTAVAAALRAKEIGEQAHPLDLPPFLRRGAP